jgi:putative aminopeptidase FrvX
VYTGRSRALPARGEGMNKKAETFLKTLLEAPSPSGYEQAAAACWRDYLRDSVDELVHDVHGNSIAILNPQAEFTFMPAILMRSA